MFVLYQFILCRKYLRKIKKKKRINTKNRKEIEPLSYDNKERGHKIS